MSPSTGDTSDSSPPGRPIAIRGRSKLGLRDPFPNPLREILTFAERSRTPLDSQSGSIRVSGNDVEVDMHHFLMRFPSVVLQNVVRRRSRRLHEATCDPRKRSSDGGGGVVAQFMKMSPGLLGYDQKVAEAQWAHIQKRQNMVILVESMAGYLPSKDASENRVFFVCIHRSNLAPAGSTRFFMLRPHVGSSNFGP